MRETVNELELDITSHPDLLAFDQEIDAVYAEAFETPPSSPWLLAGNEFPELEQSAETETVRFMGGIAIRGASRESVPASTNNESTLMSATLKASRGDEQSKQVVDNNVATDLAERMFKSAHQTRIEMVMEDGKLRQSGRNLTDLHRNALEHTVLNGEMMRRTTRELRNAHLFEQLHAAGVLETHDVAVMSASSTAMSLEEKKDYGFFLDTETCSIQLLSADGDKVVFETAFVAGKKTPDSERHDIATIQKLAASKGIEITTTDATEILGFVFLIPKADIQGVEDVVKWYDDAAGGTFYGEDKSRQDYRTYAQVCQERSNSFGGMVQEISAALIAEAPSFKTALEANVRLNELSEMHSVKRAIADTSINANVFGERSAAYVNEARFFIERGEFDRAEEATAMAIATADSDSCPWLKNMLTGGSDANDPTGMNSANEMSKKEWMNCPHCRAKVFADPCAKRLACWDCTALVVNGKVISTGNGGSNKRRAEKASTPTKNEHAGKLALVGAGV